MTVTTTPIATETQKRKLDIRSFLERFGTLGIFLVLVVVATFWSDSFISTVRLLRARASWLSVCCLSF